MSSYNGHRVEDHADYLMDEVMPSMVDYAHKKGVPTEAVAFAVFTATVAMINSAGVSRETLVMAVNAMSIQTHDAPEGLQ